MSESKIGKYVALIREIDSIDKRLMEIHDSVFTPGMFYLSGSSILRQHTEDFSEIISEINRKIGREMVESHPDALEQLARVCMCDGGGSISHVPSNKCTSGLFFDDF